MGLETARLLRSKGLQLILLGRSQASLDAANIELQSETSGDIETVSVDLHNEAILKTFISSLDPDTRHIKHVEKAAGSFKPTPFADHKTQDFDTYHAVNKAIFFITQAVARNMKSHGGGSIVKIGSMWAKQAIKATPSSAYSLAKAGLHALTQHLAMELAEDNIRVTAVSPAVVVIPIYGAFIDPTAIKETLEAGFSAFHPIDRVGQPEDIAKTIVSFV